MSSEQISVIEVAKNLRRNKAHIFKIIKRLDIYTTKEKSSDARGQRVAYINADDYERIREYSEAVASDSQDPQVQPDSSGVFYVIQLEPDLDPGRIKLGFATNVRERLRKHRTSAPFAVIVRTWPCKLLWEKRQLIQSHET